MVVTNSYARNYSLSLFIKYIDKVYLQDISKNLRFGSLTPTQKADLPSSLTNQLLLKGEITDRDRINFERKEKDKERVSERRQVSDPQGRAKVKKSSRITGHTCIEVPKNGDCYAQTVRRLRVLLGRNNAPNESTIRRLLTKFEATGNTANIPTPEQLTHLGALFRPKSARSLRTDMAVGRNILVFLQVTCMELYLYGCDDLLVAR
ncbi:hypothetical protein C0J52_25474 [Blattella germanica]|nr:hypothetical protein C0J52_25474 [Blattella germanica]